MLSLQSGVYTCTAYNHLDSRKATVRLRVHYPPQCRIRQTVVAAAPSPAREKSRQKDEEPEEKAAALRCHATLGDPLIDLTFEWTRDGRPLSQEVDGPTSGGSVLVVPLSAEGTYACRATNVAGAGSACSTKVRQRPIAAPVANSGLGAYLGFGAVGVAAVAVAAGLVAGALRRMRFGKYDFSRPSRPDPTLPASSAGILKRPPPQSAPGAPPPPSTTAATSNNNRQVIVRQDDLYVSDAASPCLTGVPPFSSSAPGAGNNGHNPANGYRKVKRVTLSAGRTVIEESMEEDDEDEGGMNFLAQEAEAYGMNGNGARMRTVPPRELWLV